MAVKPPWEAGYERFFINYFHDSRNGVSMEAFTRSVPEEDKKRFVPIEWYAEKDKVEETLQKIAAYEKEIKDLPPKRRGYFVYMHFCTTHFPWKHYNGAGMYKGAVSYGESQKELYDETMRYADITLGHIFEGLKNIRSGEKSVYDKAVIIVTADHGTGLDDHGKYAGFFPYEEQVRVPFFMKIPDPNVKPRVIDVPYTGVDLAPTLVNLVKRGVHNRFDGISFLPVLSGKEKTIDREYIINICAFHDAFALTQNNRWKLIYHRDRDYYMLYDLENDPCETRNLADKMPDKCAQMIKVLERFLWEGRDTYANPYHY